MAKEDPVPRKRRAALVALGQIAGQARDDEETTREVLAAFGLALRNDADPAVRRQAAGLIGQQPVESAALLVTDLTEAMRAEADADTRREVAATLAGFGRFAKPAVTPLTTALGDPDPGVRAAAAAALGRIGPDARVAVPKLIAMVRDPNEPARQAAVFALGRVEPEDTATAAAAILPVLAPGAAPDLRQEALQSLRFLGDRSDRVVRAVAAVLADEDVEMRRQAVAILAKFGPAVKVVADELAAAFREDTDTIVRTTVLLPLSTAYAGRTPDLIALLSARLVGPRPTRPTRSGSRSASNSPRSGRTTCCPSSGTPGGTRRSRSARPRPGRSSGSSPRRPPTGGEPTAGRGSCLRPNTDISSAG